MSTPSESMLTPLSNSIMIMETLFWLEELMAFSWSSVASVFSSGLVISASTLSGLAPGSLVTTIT